MHKLSRGNLDVNKSVRGKCVPAAGPPGGKCSTRTPPAGRLPAKPSRMWITRLDLPKRVIRRCGCGRACRGSGPFRGRCSSLCSRGPGMGPPGEGRARRVPIPVAVPQVRPAGAQAHCGGHAPRLSGHAEPRPPPELGARPSVPAAGPRRRPPIRARKLAHPPPQK